jgi:hypothetical protein
LFLPPPDDRHLMHHPPSSSRLPRSYDHFPFSILHSRNAPSPGRIASPLRASPQRHPRSYHHFPLAQRAPPPLRAKRSNPRRRPTPAG